MPHKVSWIVPDRIKLVTYSGNLQLEEFIQLNNSDVEWLDNSDLPCYLIHDLQDSKNMPPVKKTKPLSDKIANHPNFGWNILINNMNPIIRLPITLLLQITQKRFKMVKDLDTALEFLQQMDETLPQKIKTP